jgi:mTERF domain-containing protein
MKILQEKRLLNSNMSFCTFTKLGEKSFKLKFIDYHKDSISGLADAYATGSELILSVILLPW